MQSKITILFNRLPLRINLFGLCFVLCIFPIYSYAVFDSEIQDFQFASPYLQSIGDKDDIPLGAVTALQQGKNGFIWIGTQKGFLRYDGYKFRHFEHRIGEQNSVAGNYIFSLFVDSNDDVWIGTASDGVSRYQPGSNQFSHFQHSSEDPHSLTNGSVFAIAQSDANTLWIGTSEGLNEVDIGNNSIRRFESFNEPEKQLLDNRVRSILKVDNSHLYIGTSGGLQVMSLADRTLLPLSRGLAQLKGIEVRKMQTDQYQNIWIGTRENGLYRYNPGNDDLLHIEGNGEFSKINNAWIYDLLVIESGDVWVATIGNGVYQIATENNQPVQNLRSNPAINYTLHINNVSALLQDDSGLLWIGTWGEGLQRLNIKNNSFLNIKYNPDDPASPSDSVAIAITELHSGYIALGTNGKGIEILDPKLGVIERIMPEESQWEALKDGYITAIIEPEPNIIWVGTLQKGIYIVDLSNRKIVKHLSAEHNLPSNRVRTMLLNQKGDIWIGGAKGVVGWDKTTETFISLTTSTGELYDSISPQLMTDHLDRVWVGSFNGLFVKHPGSNKLVRVGEQPTENFGLLSQNIKGLFQDSKNRIWVDTDRGLHLMTDWIGDQVSFKDVSSELGYPGLYFGANMLEDSLGRLWTQWHVLDFAKKDLLELGESDGFDVGSITIGAHEKLSDGRFLFGGTDGLLLVKPENFISWDFAPLLATTAVNINGIEQSLDRISNGLNLSPKERRFTIAFSALDFSQPQNNQYQYRLQGFESNWNKIDSSIRQASYSNLWPGKYELQIKGSNRNGLISSNQLRIPINVQPAYWQTWYFVFSVLILCSASIWMFIRYRTRRLKQLAIELEAKVAVKTKNLAQVNNQLQQSNQLLSDKHHELEETFDSLRLAHEHLEEAKDKLIMQEKMASLGVLTSGVAHELNTPLGIAITAASTLKENTDNFISRMEQGRVKKQDLSNYIGTAGTSSDLVLNNLTRAGRLVNLFKQISLDRTTTAQHSIIHLSPLVDGVFSEYKQQADDLHVALNNQLTQKHQIFTVEGVLEEVFEGLFSNCFVHAFDNQNEGELTVYAQRTDKTLNIIIEDNGSGMSQEQIKHAFEPFYTSKRGSGCTGLGLHIIYNLVSGALNGEISITSTPGKGTRFVLTLPNKLSN